jgi:hypothetical protein
LEFKLLAKMLKGTLKHWRHDMSVEAFIESLSRSDKLVAMELIWRDLTADPSSVESPAWHDSVVHDRLANPLPDAPLGLKEAFDEIQGWRNGSKATS